MATLEQRIAALEQAKARESEAAQECSPQEAERVYRKIMCMPFLPTDGGVVLPADPIEATHVSQHLIAA